MHNVIEARELSRDFGDFALDAVSLDLPRGTILGLIGPNGSGKTTTIRMLMNMLSPDSGSIRIFGMDFGGSEVEIKNRIGYVGEEQYYYSNKRISWTARFVSRFYDRWDGIAFNGLMREFGLDPKAKTGKLSKGMKVRLSFAIAFSHHPELMILDEPTAGLDPVIRREMLDRLLAFRDESGGSVLISSHITDDIVRIADHVAFILDGRIVLHAEKDEILSDWKRIHYREGALDARTAAGLSRLERRPFGSTGITGRYRDLEPALSGGIASGDVRVENVSLDDVLIAFVEGGRGCGE